MPLYPVFLDIAKRSCLVVGSGKVGQRKMRALLAAGATVQVVSLEPAPSDLASEVEWIIEPFQASHLDGACLAFAAATPEVNREVVAAANASGIWVNSASEPGEGSLILPASGSKGRIQIAIGTDGASPKIAAQLRDFLVNQVDEAMVDWVELMASLRRDIQDRISNSQRTTLLLELADPRWLERLRDHGRDRVESEMRAVVEAFLNR